MRKVARVDLTGRIALSNLLRCVGRLEIWLFLCCTHGGRKRVQALEYQEYFLFLHVVNWRIARRNYLIVSE